MKKLYSPCSAVILAGGLNSRMGGRNKAFMKLGRETLLARISTVLKPLFNEVLIVTREPELYRDLPWRVVEDRLRVRSSLTGVHTGLCSAREEFIFVVPCDVPFLRAALVRLLLSEIDGDSDVIVPFHDRLYEPLCAVYGRRCIAPIEALLAKGDFTIYHLYDHIRFKPIPAERIRVADPDLISFFNVNTPEAYQRAQAHFRYGTPLEKTAP
ncbi:MAG: molybdenum cofactor guanylyltransferase [Desulfobacterales bacterium]